MQMVIGAVDDGRQHFDVSSEYDLTKRGLALFRQLPVELQAKISRYVLADTNIKRKLFDKPRVKHILQGHTGAVNSVAFNPNGTQIVSASSDNTVRTWDALTGRELHILHGHKSWVRSAEFSQDGKRIVSASDDGTLCIWDASEGRLLHTLPHNDPQVLSVAFNEAGNCVISVSYDKTIRIRDIGTTQLLCTLRYDGPVAPSSEAFYRVRNQMVLANNDNSLHIQDTHTFQKLYILRGHTNVINWAAFNRDGTKVISASADKTVRIWDALAGKELYVLHGHKNWVRSAVFNKVRDQVVSAGDDCTVRLWEPLPYEDYYFDLEQTLWMYCRYGMVVNGKAEQVKNRSLQLGLSESYLSLICPIFKLIEGVRVINNGIKAIIGTPELSKEEIEQLAIEQSIREQYPEILDAIEE
jgi:WD40 repeat protein